ncbi:hypothetical protein F5146DRAFT_1224957 [Armillaria mellea]|nr:hypothetical protein F5146DRAFT_1224957 [Armillaria mellea]
MGTREVVDPLLTYQRMVPQVGDAKINALDCVHADAMLDLTVLIRWITNRIFQTQTPCMNRLVRTPESSGHTRMKPRSIIQQWLNISGIWLMYFSSLLVFSLPSRQPLSFKHRRTFSLTSGRYLPHHCLSSLSCSVPLQVARV